MYEYALSLARGRAHDRQLLREFHVSGSGCPWALDADADPMPDELHPDPVSVVASDISYVDDV
eukprot:9283768-Pyramimonas_sp.AAC.1